MFQQVFNVATTFRFEIGSAVANTKSLTGHVEKLSNAADDVVIAFQRVGMGVMANLGMGAGGMLGLIMKSTSSFEHFKHAQLNFANAMTAMGDKLSGPIDTFNEKMLFSQAVLGDLAKKAREFALPQTQMIGMAEQLMPALGQKGLLGDNMKNLTEFTRNLLKAAPAMGVDPQTAQQQSLQMMTGGASMNQTFFQRLTFDTDAMEKFKNDAGAFNKLDAHKKFGLLLSGLQQFTKDADVLSGRVDLISSQFQIIKDTLTGVSGILLPLGQAINKMVVPILMKFEEYLHTFGREIIKNFVIFFDTTVGSLKNLLLLALQLREATNDVSKAGATLGLIGLMQIFGGISAIAKGWSMFGGKIIAFIKGSVAFIGKMGLISKGFGILSFIFKTILWPLTLLITLFQLFSRASAIAKLKDMEAMPAIMARFSKQAVRMGKAWDSITKPFRTIFNYLAELLSPIFRISYGIEFLSSVTEMFVRAAEGLANIMSPLNDGLVALARGIRDAFYDIMGTIGIIISQSLIGAIGRIIAFGFNWLVDHFINGFKLIYAHLTGFLNAFIKLADNFLSGRFLSLNDGVAESFNLGYDSIMNKNKTEDEDGNPTSINNTYIDNVTVKNNFKENMHPDRIAFTIVDQLGKVGRNKVRAAGGTTLATASSVGVN